jgi:ADP-dependent NAD(P)H-hydrate dehydratase / NAD(P)H-hydrate epimerase
MKPFLATAEQMRDIDRITIEEYGIPGVVLMENAGANTARVLNAFHPQLEHSHTTVVAGKGNNGGDGFVVARHLYNQSCSVEVLLLGRRCDLHGDAKINADIAATMSIPITEISSEDEPYDLTEILCQSDVIVDAIFGTGLSNPAGGVYGRAIETINDTDAFIVSVDIPSGLCADSPAVTGPVIIADLTVTYGLAKPALILYPAAEFAGQVVVADISIPNPVIQDAALNGQIITPDSFKSVLCSRHRNCHKGDFGHLLVVAGSPGKTGAAILASRSALRCGTGLVTAATCEDLNGVFESNLLEVMTAPVPGKDNRFFDASSLEPVLRLAESKSAVLIGPGLGTDPDTQAFIRDLVSQLTVPMVIDADGLNGLAGSPLPWNQHGQPIVITPHPGEMSRLAEMSTQDILRNPLGCLTSFSRSRDVNIVFKTARSIVTAPDGHWMVNITGNPGLASGGTGDVLAGMIAGYLAQGHTVESAAAAGVFIHGLAADIAASLIGESELIAGDLLDCIGPAKEVIHQYPDYFDGTIVPYPPLPEEEFDYE